MRSIIFILLIVCTVHPGCKRDLELAPADALLTSEALSTMQGIQSALNGTYAKLRDVDYYGRSMLVYGDLSSNNVYLARNNTNRYILTYQRNYSASDINIRDTWNDIYNAVSRANNILNNVDKVTATQAERDLAKGQALFLRALCYFDLVRLFAKPYNQGMGTQMGVPVVTVSDVKNNPSRNTVAEVYDLIINDLVNAKTLLQPTTEAVKFTASRFAASALLSRVYLYKGDYARAITEASVVTGASYILVPASALPAFYSTAGSNEEIFTLKFATTESLGSDNIGNMYLKPGYGDIRVSPDLVAFFDIVNDLRYKSFISPFSTSPTEFQNNKFRSQDGLPGLYSPKILRLGEILLNRSEAYAKSSQPLLALPDLNLVRRARGLSDLSGLQGQRLIDSILVERRRELMFEGHQFFDLTRNGLPLARTYCNQPAQVNTPNCTLPAADPKMIAPIPQSEIDANPGMKDQQNESY
jgi:hypothetical protein